MRTMAIESFGESDVLRPTNLPRPLPGPGEVLIHVVSAGVNPVDCMIRRGDLADALPHSFPIVPGWDAAGTVEELGEGASRFRKGDRVWACAAKPTVQWGCYAEYVCVPETQVAQMPAKLLFEEAAAVPTAALTAQQTLAGVHSGQAVLVHGGSGGVGHFAIQLAKLSGAVVAATAGTANQPMLLGLGADYGIDYTKEDFRDACRKHFPQGVDRVVDTRGGETQQRSFDILAEGGQVVALTEEPPPEHAARAARLNARPDGDLLAHFAQLFDLKKLKVQVQRIFNLKDAPVAHRLVEEGHVAGKLVLNL